MKVYLVTSGEYSDYRIDAVFKTRELAEEAILKEMTLSQREKWVENPDEREINIEEHEVLESTDQILTYSAYRDFYGKYRAVAEKIYQQYWEHEYATAWSSTITPSHRTKKYWVNARALTKERALKIAQDAIAKLKAEEAGL